MFETFEQLVDIVPDNIKNELERLKTYKENNDYHPEDSAYEHIKIVTERLFTTNDINLILSGLFHDITKLIACEITFDKTGKFRSFGHDKLSGDFVLKNKEFIESLGGDVDEIHSIVINHMRMGIFDEMGGKKKNEMRKLPVFDKLCIFARADNMLNDFVI